VTAGDQVDAGDVHRVAAAPPHRLGGWTAYRKLPRNNRDPISSVPRVDGVRNLSAEVISQRADVRTLRSFVS
jgi:hypothetical protein